MMVNCIIALSISALTFLMVLVIGLRVLVSLRRIEKTKTKERGDD